MVDAKRIMGVMGLALKHGEELTMTFDGSDAVEAAENLEAFLRETL
jgi:phosphocarrier protein